VSLGGSAAVLAVLLLLALYGAYITFLVTRHSTDRAFIPQQDPPPEEWRASHRPPDPPGN